MRRGRFTVMLAVTAVVSMLLGASGALLGAHLWNSYAGDREEDPYAVYLEAAKEVEDRFIGSYAVEDAVEASIDGLISGLGDRWSYYLSADEVGQYQETMTNTFTGIGVSVTKADGEGMRIQEVYEGSGAQEAGLTPGDEIIAADGISLLEYTLDEGKTYVSGTEGSQVVLTIRHADGSQEDITVTRHSIYLSPISGELIGAVGYIRIEDFDDGAGEAFIAEADRLQEEGAEAFVFDVRFNNGGYVRELTTILDYLLPEGVIFDLRDKDGSDELTNSDKKCLELPMAVLVNSGSFSAAEYFAACLQEYGAATVVGEKTVGKGYSQQALYLRDGSALVLSTKAYFTPNGRSLAETGVTPELEVLLTEEQNSLLFYQSLTQEEDTQLQAALAAVAVA